jgi:hypothetical protein
MHDIIVNNNTAYIHYTYQQGREWDERDHRVQPQDIYTHYIIEQLGAKCSRHYSAFECSHYK